MQAVLKDWRTAPIDEKLRLTLGLLAKLTLVPESIGPADIKPLREAGISETAIEQAIYICALFNIIDRIADALNFNVPADEVFAQRVHNTLQRGYSFAGMQRPNR